VKWRTSAINYEQWSEQNTDIKPLVRALKSSIPEQYIGFYLGKVFGEGIEYQKQFDWFGNNSLDIYIPSLQLAVEYDGSYYHAERRVVDNNKTNLCRAHGIHTIRVIELDFEQENSRKCNEINYYYTKGYGNTDIVIYSLFEMINRKYGMSLLSDVDLKRDEQAIISYVQDKYYKRTIACIWPESKDYWSEENETSIFDVFHTSYGEYKLKCPHCGRNYTLYMRYYRDKKAIKCCECEFNKTETDFVETIKKYKETGELVIFDNSIQSRRLFDRMAIVVDKMWRCESKEEAEMYKKLGFTSPYIDVYLELCRKQK